MRALALGFAHSACLHSHFSKMRGDPGATADLSLHRNFLESQRQANPDTNKKNIPKTGKLSSGEMANPPTGCLRSLCQASQGSLKTVLGALIRNQNKVRFSELNTPPALAFCKLFYSSQKHPGASTVLERALSNAEDCPS